MTLKNTTYKGNQFKSSWSKLDGEERNVGKKSNKTKQFSMNQGKTGFLYMNLSSNEGMFEWVEE